MRFLLTSKELTKALHNEFKMTTIFVTHDTDEALKLADRIAVLKDGEIQQVASPSEILASPATAFVAELLKEVSVMNNLITTFQDRFSDWTVALGQHLQLSLLALLISILIAVSSGGSIKFVSVQQALFFKWLGFSKRFRP